MHTSKDLLPVFLREYPFQPATAVWRSVEISELLNYGVPEGEGLDLGCGDGVLTSILNGYLDGDRSWFGVDLDSSEVDLARRLSIYSECVVSEGARLPFESSRFDFVVSNSVLEHIQDIDPVLTEVCRVLKPGGRFIFTVPNDRFYGFLKGPLLPWVKRSAYLDSVDRRCAHVRYFSEDSWRLRLADAGMEVGKCIDYLNIGEVRCWELFSRFTGGFLYGVFAGKKQPIQIQRLLGMRRFGGRLPGFVVSILSRCVERLCCRESQVGSVGSCYLIDAVKKQ